MKYDVSKDAKLLDKYVSKNFQVKEFRCADGSPIIIIDDNQVKCLQKLRDKIAKSMHINSGYRTDSYNKKCGGIKGSEHTKGKADDIQVAGLTPLQVAKIADSLHIFTGIGVYTTFTHVDTGSFKGYWYQDANDHKTFYDSLAELEQKVFPKK